MVGLRSILRLIRAHASRLLWMVAGLAIVLVVIRAIDGNRIAGAGLVTYFALSGIFAVFVEGSRTPTAPRSNHARWAILSLAIVIAVAALFGAFAFVLGSAAGMLAVIVAAAALFGKLFLAPSLTVAVDRPLSAWDGLRLSWRFSSGATYGRIIALLAAILSTWALIAVPIFSGILRVWPALLSGQAWSSGALFVIGTLLAVPLLAWLAASSAAFVGGPIDAPAPAIAE
jgi:hypothetical protein